MSKNNMTVQHDVHKKQRQEIWTVGKNQSASLKKSDDTNSYATK